ncbi:MAG: UDP-N-acetylmuramate dehydrogenase [Alphaproteobacteria bacterium]
MTDETRTLIDRLPKVRGSYRENFPLADFTWFRVGGPAEVVFKPADVDDLADFMRAVPKDIPLTVVGVGSNLLVRDGGLDGVVIRLSGKGFSSVSVEGARIKAGAGALDAMVAKQAAKAGLKGLGFLVGVPGTIGGALRMNAGAHGGETKDFLTSATVVTDTGEIKKLTPEEIGHTYRSCKVPKNWIFVAAEFDCQTGDTEELAAELKHIQKTREETQPIKSRTGGSTFKNPPENSSWKLVDQAGCRGLRIGGAQMSTMHCNFMLNVDQATAADLELLGETVRERVLDKTGIELQWEIKRIGKKTDG